MSKKWFIVYRGEEHWKVNKRGQKILKRAKQETAGSWRREAEESWCIIEYVLILVEIVEMNMNTIGSYCNPPPARVTALVAWLLFVIMNTLTWSQGKLILWRLQASCSDPPGAAMAVTGSVVMEFRASGKKDNVESQDVVKSSVKSQKCSKFFWQENGGK